MLLRSTSIIARRRRKFAAKAKAPYLPKRTVTLPNWKFLRRLGSLRRSKMEAYRRILSVAFAAMSIGAPYQRRHAQNARSRIGLSRLSQSGHEQTQNCTNIDGWQTEISDLS